MVSPAQIGGILLSISFIQFRCIKNNEPFSENLCFIECLSSDHRINALFLDFFQFFRFQFFQKFIFRNTVWNKHTCISFHKGIKIFHYSLIFWKAIHSAHTWNSTNRFIVHCSKHLTYWISDVTLVTWISYFIKPFEEVWQILILNLIAFYNRILLHFSFHSIF